MAMIKNGQPQVYAILKVWKMLGSFHEQLSQEPISAASPKKGLRCIELKCFIQNEPQNINDPKLGDSQVVTVRRPALSWAPLPSFSYRGPRFSYWDALSLSQFLFDWFLHCCGIRTLLVLKVVHVHNHIKWSLLDSESGLRLSSSGFLLAAFSPTVAVSLQPSHRWVISIQVCQSIFMQEIKNICIKIC